MYLEEISFSCPYCWETNVTDMDPSNLNSPYVEDCQVCCRPILITLAREGEEIYARVERENG